MMAEFIQQYASGGGAPSFKDYSGIGVPDILPEGQTPAGYRKGVLSDFDSLAGRGGDDEKFMLIMSMFEALKRGESPQLQGADGVPTEDDFKNMSVEEIMKFFQN